MCLNFNTPKQRSQKIQSEKPPPSEVLLDLASALAVSVESLVHESAMAVKRNGT